MTEPKHSAEWELIEGTGSGIRQFRQKVPGGWLTLVAMDETNSLAFVPDPDHQWDPPIKVNRKIGGDFF